MSQSLPQPELAFFLPGCQAFECVNMLKCCHSLGKTIILETPICCVNLIVFLHPAGHFTDSHTAASAFMVFHSEGKEKEFSLFQGSK